MQMLVYLFLFIRLFVANIILSIIDWHLILWHEKRKEKNFSRYVDDGQSSEMTLHGTDTDPIVDQLLW